MRILPILLLSFSLFTYSQSEDHLAMCESLKGLATVIMQNRQQEVDLSKMINLAQESEEPFKSAMMELIIIAYEEPAYSSESYQLNSVKKFSNSVYLECIKSSK
jgi:hypothetical protein